jgi:hypothetical protein
MFTLYGMSTVLHPSSRQHLHIFFDLFLLLLPTMTDSTTTRADDEVQDQQLRKSALQDNLERKGKNAYYFAHAHKADGPAWDGKPEPKLLARHTTHEGHELSPAAAAASFDYSKSNITTYAFVDDGAKVKLYIELENVGEKCQDEDVTLDFAERSLSLQITNYKEAPQILSFGKLTAEISSASYRLKKDRVIVTLEKVDADREWHTITDKGTPDHEVV